MADNHDQAYPFVSIYTITYRQKQRVQKTVGDLLRLDYPADRYEIIVLDDGSGDGSYEALCDLAADAAVRIKVLQTRHEADYLSARRWNQCIAAANPASTIFIQIDDVWTRPDFIKAHLRWHRLPEEHLVTGAKFEGDHETWELSACQRKILASQDSGAAPCNFLAVWGASMSFTRRMAARVAQEPYDRPYDERMVGWGFQEVELAYRMQIAGARLVYDPAAGVFHPNHTRETEQARGLDREALVDKGFSQNERYVVQKHSIESLPWWKA